MVLELEKRFSTNKDEIETIVKKTLNTHHLDISQFIIENLSIHLTLCVLREINGTYIPTSDSQVSHLKTHEYYQYSKEIIKAINEHYQIELDKDQIAVTTMYLADINLLDIDFDYEFDLSDEYDIKTVIYEAVDEIKKQMGIDLHEYPEFYRGITLHFYPALERLRSNTQLINNPLKDQIKAQNQLEYQCALIFNSVVEKYYHQSFNEHELAYIAVHFGTISLHQA